MSIGGRSLHKEDWMTLGALAAVPIGGGIMGMGPLAGLLGGGQMSAGALGALGGMGAEQAAMLAAQNAGLGMAADVATLGAAAGSGGGLVGGLAGAGKGLDALMRAQALMQLAAGNGQQIALAGPQKKQRKQSGTGLDYISQIYS
jgi:hypothetical protein